MNPIEGGPGQFPVTLGFEFKVADSRIFGRLLLAVAMTRVKPEIESD
jgi:hypothetical protein